MLKSMERRRHEPDEGQQQQQQPPPPAYYPAPPPATGLPAPALPLSTSGFAPNIASATGNASQGLPGTQQLPYAEPMFDMIDGIEPLDWSLLDQYFQGTTGVPPTEGQESWDTAAAAGTTSGSYFDDLHLN